MSCVRCAPSKTTTFRQYFPDSVNVTKMNVSTEQAEEVWINKAFCVPSVPESGKTHYPFSKCSAVIYRLKLAVVLLNAVCALCRVNESCLLLSLCINFWLIFVTCEGVYKNYPWREPLNIWMRKLRWGLSTLCFVSLLLIWAYLGTGCELPRPLVNASAGWLCCMVCWPVIRERWHLERLEGDYDQFSAARPTLLTLPGPLVLVAAALRSPSLLNLLVAIVFTSTTRLFLFGWVAEVWTAVTSALAFGYLAVLCCHRLPEDVQRTLAAWEVDEADYVRRIGNSLRIVKGNLRTSGVPSIGSSRFDRLAIQVPLLQREADILLCSSRTLTENGAEELRNLTAASDLMEFRERLVQYGPYTSECCVS